MIVAALDIDLDTVVAGGTIDLEAPGTIDAPNLTAGGSILLDAATALGVDTLDAGLDIVIDAPSITFTSATAGRDMTLTAAGDIDFGSAEAGDDFLATATGNFTANTVDATGLGPDSEAGLGDLAGSNLTILVAGVVDVGSLRAADDVLVDPISVTIGSVVAGGDITLDASTFIDVGSADANDDFVATAGTTFTAGTVIARGVKDGEQGSGSALEGGNIFVDAGDDLRLDNGDAATDIQLTSRLGSVLSATLLDAGSDIRGTAAQNIDLAGGAAGATIGLTATAGFIDAASLTTTTGSITTNSGTDTDIAAAGAGASLLVTAGGSADLGTVSAATDIVVGASAITLANGAAARDLQLNAPGAIQVTVASAGDDFTANAGTTFTGGTVTTTGGADSEGGAGALAGSNIAVNSVGNLRLDTATAPALIDLASSAGSVLSNGTLTANRLLATTALNLDLNDVFVIATLDLTTTGGLIDGNRFDSNGDINLAASGNVNVAIIRAGDDLVVQGGGNGAFTDIQADSIAIDLVGSAGFAGAIRAPTATVSSANIDIAGTASFGDAATQLVSLTARPSAQQTVVGGGAAGPGYTLTDAEADRITAATLRIQASPTGAAANRAPDLLIRDLSLDGQRIGRLDVRTSEIVQVEGALLVTGVQATGGVNIRADERLQIVNPTGSLQVRDAAGMTDGSVNLTSNNIWSASQALLDQLRANSNFAGRDDALTANGGPVEERGYIEAGDVTLFARDSLFVQNSGTAASFAGITVRENTLRIVPTGAQPLRVFAFGRRINPDGSFVTNNAFFNEAQYDGRGGPVGYTADAQLNRCFINTGCPAAPPPNQPQPPNFPGGPEIVTEPVGGSFTLTLPGAADDLVDTSFADEPLIEEPVTSGGDSILWDCDNDDDGDCDEEDYDG